jgi:hypothetical protein
MCDTIAGELLVCFHEADAAAKGLMEDIYGGKISHVSIIEELSHRIDGARLLKRKGLQFKFYRLKVPIGQEVFKINYLHFYYKHAVLDALKKGQMDLDVFSRSNFHLQVVPHSILSINCTVPGSPGVGFSFTQTHDNYKNMVGWGSRKIGSVRKRVLILDTGLDPSAMSNVVDQRNFIDYTKLTDVTDDNGHGTAVVSVIKDLFPPAEFVIYKVADANGRASEWDTLAALAAESDADLVNISLAFGLASRICPYCGRESHSSRSAVFENMIDQLEKAVDGPLLVAAAGNDGLDELSFPARFDKVIAVASVNLGKQLSAFTNRAAIDQVGSRHHNVFVLPGGEKPQATAPTEYIGTSSTGEKYYGTSFSAAYASGIIAGLLSQPSNTGKDRAQLLDHLRKNADSNLPNYNYSTHGNGMMRYV